MGIFFSTNKCASRTDRHVFFLGIRSQFLDLTKVTENCEDLHSKDSCVSRRSGGSPPKGQSWGSLSCHRTISQSSAVCRMASAQAPSCTVTPQEHLREGPVAPVWAKVSLKIAKTGCCLSLLAARRTSYVRKLILINHFLKGSRCLIKGQFLS